jgi:hypothetical protein
MRQALRKANRLLWAKALPACCSENNTGCGLQQRCTVACKQSGKAYLAKESTTGTTTIKGRIKSKLNRLEWLGKMHCWVHFILFLVIGFRKALLAISSALLSRK